jgi:hypothetical protein
MTLQLDPKTCSSCGRPIAGHSPRQHPRPSVRYCSGPCRRRGVNRTDVRLEQAIIELLARRPDGATIDPEAAAQRVFGDAWRSLIEPTHRAARRLAADGRVVITHDGRVVDASSSRGSFGIRFAATHGRSGSDTGSDTEAWRATSRSPV